ncbi:MAG: 16S rRNA (guanine(527)-N(7))-methyltransferase RsmG [Cytophagales bacterium]
MSVDFGADIMLLLAHFPDLSAAQITQYKALGELYTAWNEKINLISRRDIGNLYPRHVLHSLSITKIITFQPGTTVLDVGTGGGFPGIPLAIMFPNTNFTLVDSIGKKIKAVTAIASALGLKNVSPICCRVEAIKTQHDFVVSRATAKLDTLYGWIKDKIKPKSCHAIPNGLLYLTGGDLTDALQHLNVSSRIYQLAPVFPNPFFQTKKVVHLYLAPDKASKECP